MGLSSYYEVDPVHTPGGHCITNLCHSTFNLLLSLYTGWSHVGFWVAFTNCIHVSLQAVDTWVLFSLAMPLKCV